MHRTLFLLCAALTIVSGCKRSPTDQAPRQSKSNSRTPVVVLPPESWAEKAPREWPQMALTNLADFNGHTSLHGASAFLIRTSDGRVLAATARHLIGENGGVEPEIQIPQLNTAIKSWRLYPRTLPNNFVSAMALGAEGLDDELMDWLILTLKEPVGTLPAQPLHLRADRIKVGEPVYLIGCPYSERNCKQNVYKGTVTARYGDRFRYDIDPPVDIRGFSGAPILDSNGHVVGVMTVWFEPKMRGDDYLEAGGEDAASVYPLVERK